MTETLAINLGSFQLDFILCNCVSFAPFLVIVIVQFATSDYLHIWLANLANLDEFEYFGKTLLVFILIFCSGRHGNWRLPLEGYFFVLFFFNDSDLSWCLH